MRAALCFYVGFIEEESERKTKSLPSKSVGDLTLNVIWKNYIVLMHLVYLEVAAPNESKLEMECCLG